MENKENEKTLTFKGLMKFNDDVLMPVMDRILDRLEKLEVENRREHQEIRRDHQGLRKEFEELRRDVLNGQGALAKLIEDKRENEAMDTSIRRRFSVIPENFGAASRRRRNLSGIHCFVMSL